MIRHIIKVIWNERRSNVLIFLEFIVVFCVFWFCSDYLYYLGSLYLEPLGYDIEHTYIIDMRKNNEIEENKEDRYAHAMLLKDRLGRYPGVEAVSISRAAIPYGNTVNIRGYLINNDSVSYSALHKYVSPRYFDVFKIQINHGHSFSEIDEVNENKVVLISPDRYGYFRDKNNPGLWATGVEQLRQSKEDDPYTVTGVVEKQKRMTFDIYGYACAVFLPMTRSQYELRSCEIVIRINPAVAEGFTERFTRDMKEQLTIGPYSFENITSLPERKERYDDGNVGNNLKSVLAITAFLFINVFLGIIGTFWSRTESRRNEIGLRLALGSSRRKIQLQMLIETMILLFVAGIIGVYICVNLGQSDLLKAIGIPLADYEQAGFGSGHSVINCVITFLFLAVISGFAVWYPSRLASGIQPADALRLS